MMKHDSFYKTLLILILSMVVLFSYGDETHVDYNVYHSQSKTQLIVDGTARANDFVLVMQDHYLPFQGIDKGKIIRFYSNNDINTLGGHADEMHDYPFSFQHSASVLNELSINKKKVLDNHIASQYGILSDTADILTTMENVGFSMLTIPVVHIPEHMPVERIARVFLSTLKAFSNKVTIDELPTFLIKYSDNLDVIIPILRVPLTDEFNDYYWEVKAQLFSKMLRENMINLYY